MKDISFMIYNVQSTMYDEKNFDTILMNDNFFHISLNECWGCINFLLHLSIVFDIGLDVFMTFDTNSDQISTLPLTQIIEATKPETLFFYIWECYVVMIDGYNAVQFWKWEQFFFMILCYIHKIYIFFI